jgi:hypothetical protein
MKTVAILFLLCGTMACSAAPDADANAAANAADNAAAAVNIAAPERLAGETGLTTAVTCYGRMYGMARLYRAIQAAPPSGVDPAEMASLVETHQLGAANFMAEAHRLGAETGRSEGQVRALLDGAEQEINAEHDRREFTDFSRWLAGEADRCTAIGMAQS